MSVNPLPSSSPNPAPSLLPTAAPNTEPFGPVAATPIKQNSLVVLLIPLVFLAGLAAGYLIWGRNTGAAATAAQTAATQPTKRYDIPTTGSPSIGPANAPITLVEFSDYECPYCRQWHDQVYHRLLQDYKDKIRFVYRDYPLTGLHPDAVSAAEAADCAGEQGVYWQYHDLLFSGQFALGLDGYQKYASTLKLDLTKFNDCVSKRRYQAAVQNNYQFAATLGISSTPTFFINGLALVGAQSYDVFKQVIDMELTGKIAK